MATLDDASTCPKCSKKGVEVGRRPVRPQRGALGQQTSGGYLISFQCQHQLCRWYNAEPWVVQLRPDGTVPDPDMRPREKQFPALDNEPAKRMIDNLEGLLQQSIDQGKQL